MGQTTAGPARHARERHVGEVEVANAITSLEAIFTRQALELEQWRSRFHAGQALPGLYSLARDCFRFDRDMVVATKSHHHRNPGNGNEK